MKLYGTSLCPDCVEANNILDKANVKYDYINIMESTANLKEFLQYRDKRTEFIAIRADGLLGIPCFVYGEDEITFEITTAINQA